MKLRIEPPQLAANHFEIPIDETRWDGGYAAVPKAFTPARSRATFRSLSAALVPTSPWARSLGKCGGLYVLAFDLPAPSLYIGIAADDGKAPEGLLGRIRKHRVKATGSHVGSSAGTCGGVHHPGKWQAFARRRREHFDAVGSPDDLGDLRILTARIVSADGDVAGLQRKGDLERFEAALCRNDHGWLDALVARLWSERPASVRLVTSRVRSGSTPGPGDDIEWAPPSPVIPGEARSIGRPGVPRPDIACAGLD